MNLFHIYKAQTVLHIMLYSTLKIIMFKSTNYYKALKKQLWQIILLFSQSAGPILCIQRLIVHRCHGVSQQHLKIWHFVP